MLPPEIEPFAQNHIQKLDRMRGNFEDALADKSSDMFEISRDDLTAMAEELRAASRALYRFQVCMIDEHKMKERLEQQRRTCRLTHRDK